MQITKEYIGPLCWAVMKQNNVKEVTLPNDEVLHINSNMNRNQQGARIREKIGKEKWI